MTWHLRHGTIGKHKPLITWRDKVIKKAGKKYLPVSESGKRFLKKPVSKKKAVKRLQQVEYFKHLKGL